MSLDPVNRLNQMMEVLRRQMAETAGRMESGRATTVGSAVKQGKQAGKPELNELRVRIQERLRALDPTDPRRPQKAKRLFLESVLAWEFGTDLLLDRRFGDMLDGIQETISASPELETRFAELLDELAAG